MSPSQASKFKSSTLQAAPSGVDSRTASQQTAGKQPRRVDRDFTSLIDSVAKSMQSEAIGSLMNRLNKNKTVEAGSPVFSSLLRRGTIDPRGKESELIRLIRKKNRISLFNVNNQADDSHKGLNTEQSQSEAAVSSK